MNIIKSTVQECEEATRNGILNKSESLRYTIYDDNYVLLGSDIVPNMEYIKNHNVKIFNIVTGGGTIITSPGDIGVGMVSSDTNKINETLLLLKQKLIELLNERGLDISEENNDILIDGYKCASYASKAITNDVCFGAFQFSVNINLELINNISNKPMIKVPKGLSDFGITTEDIEEQLKSLN